MTRRVYSIHCLSLLTLLLAGCASTNSKPAFNEIAQEVAKRSDYELRWMQTDAERGEIEKGVATLLQTNLSAQTAVAVALLNNRSLQAQFEEIGISQAELSAAARLRNPEFEGSWRLPNRGPRVVNAEYALAQNFLDLIMLPARKEMAARHVAATKLHLAHAVLSLVAEVQAAFYTLQASEQLTNRFALLTAVNEAGADLAQRQLDAGNISDLESAQQQAAYLQARLALAQAHAQVRAARERVNRLLGMWGPQTSFQTDAGLPPLPEKEALPENVEALAIGQRLDLAAARSEVLQAQSALKLKKNMRWIPGARVGFDAEREIDHTWLVGPTLSFEIPLFDQGQPELARLAATHRRALRTLEALAIQIRSEARAARDALLAARDVAQYHEKTLLPQRQRILRETLLHYNAMQKSNYELLLAKEQEQQEEQAAIEALRDYWIARAELDRALGGALPGQKPPAPAPPGPKPISPTPAGHEHHH